MALDLELLLLLAAFGLIALAARQIGRWFSRRHLPLITGFLFTGILAGPYLLGMIGAEAMAQLRFVDEIALAFIAFAAGAELDLQELKSRFRTIRWVTLGLVVSTFVLGSSAVLLFADWIPFMREMTAPARMAVALLAGSVLVARSPSSAIAVINELRARGPLTKMALGVTVIMDVVVIVLFAINSSIADALFTPLRFDPRFILVVVAEVVASVILGALLGRVLGLAAGRRAPLAVKSLALLVIGWGVFLFSARMRHLSAGWGPFEVLLEPLLICMVAGFVVTNFTSFRTDFERILNLTGPPVYLVFFTLAGASLNMEVLARTWPIALALFAVRLVAIFIGSFFGGVAAGEPMRLNRIAWMSFVTQAGIGLGLAKEVAVEFPDWGAAFATTIISVIVLNQVVGPPLFKWALGLAGESRVGAGRRDLESTPTALIFGLEGQALALARQLHDHGWQVRIVTRQEESPGEVPEREIEIVHNVELTAEALKAVGAPEAQAIVSLLADEDSSVICEIAFEHFGTHNLIVRSDDRTYWDRYRALGVHVIDPAVAMVALLDHFVRSPTAAGLLLGMQPGQDVLDIEVRNPELERVALRDLRLPLDTLVLSVRRNGAMLISHGYTRLERGDRVTIVGSRDSVEQVALRFEG